MKKKFILAIFGISLLFMACQEDSYYNGYDMGGKNSSILTEAMKLIEDNHDFVSLPDLDKTLKGGSATRSSSSNHSLRYEEEDFIFDWGEADVMTSKVAEVVIAPVKYSKEMALRSITLEGNSRKRETTPLHSILYMRKMLETGQTHAYILSFAPDRDYINACEENGEELQLYPNPQGSNFSGIQFFSTIYGEITHGIRYENGRKCYYILPRSDRNREFIEKYRNGDYCDHECDSTHTHVKMSLEFITATAATRSTYSNNSEDNGGLLCSICNKNVYECTCVEIVECGVCRKQPCICDEYIEEEEERCPYCMCLVEYCGCNDTWGDQGGTSGPNPGGYPPTPSYPPGYKPGTGSGSGGTTDSSISISDSLSRITTKELVKLNEKDVSSLNDIIDQLIENGGNHQKLFNKLVESKAQITFQLGDTKDGPAIFDKNILVFKCSDAITYENFIEEFVHAVQYNCFYNYNMNPQYGNYELEAKMVCDILCAEAGSGCMSKVSQYVLPSGRGYATIYDKWVFLGNYSNYQVHYNNLKAHFDYSNDGQPDFFIGIYPKILKFLYGGE